MHFERNGNGNGELAMPGDVIRVVLADDHAVVRAGLRAVLGIRPVALRGAAMAVAPRRVLQRRNAVRYDPEVWLRRYGA